MCRDPLLRADLRFWYYKVLAEYKRHIEVAKDEAVRRRCTAASRRNLFGIPFKIAFQKFSPPSVLPPLHSSDISSTSSTLQSAALLLRTLLPTDDSEGDTLAHRAMRTLIRRTAYAQTTTDYEFTMNELRLAARNLNLNSAPGPDGITTSMLALLVGHASPFLLSVFNACLSLGHFPSVWKEARVIFLLKPNRPPQDPSSYRTICISSLLGKLLERMLNGRLYFFLHTSSLLHEHQYGFTQGQSATSALHNLRLRLQAWREEGSLALLISLDFKGAFDSIWHPFLLYFLRAHRCPFNIYRLLESFLHGRSVHYRSHAGSVRVQTTMGSPQGSPLSPLLWNIAIHDLLCLPVPPNVHIQAYADDTVVVIKGGTRRALENLANETLEKILKWTGAAKLKLNPTKCTCLLVSRGQRGAQRKPTIKLCGTTLRQVTEMKLLGVVFDSHLTFVAHTNHLRNRIEKMSAALIGFARLHSFLDRSHLRLLYHRAILPTVTYAAAAWWGDHQHHLLKAKIHSLMRSSLFVVTGAYTTTRTAALEVLANSLPLSIVLDIETGLFDLFHRRQSTELHGTRIFPGEVEHPLLWTCCHPALRLAIPHRRIDCRTAEKIKLSPGLHAYTDGSFTTTSAGAAFVVLSSSDEVLVTQRFRILPPTSSYGAEAIALHRLFLYLNNNKPSCPVFIYSDCLSLLLALGDPFNPSETVHEIQVNYQSLASSVPVSLFHVPSHSGVWGNELADLVATSAATRGAEVEGRTSKRIVRARLLKVGRLEWQRRWSSDNTDTELFRWVPSVLAIPPFFPPPRRLAQLLTGHGRFPHYFHRVDLLHNNTCFCGLSAPSISHYLLDCAKTVPFVSRLSRLVRLPLEPPYLRQALDNAEAVKILIGLVEFVGNSMPDISRQ